MTLRMLRVAIVSSKRDTHGASGISFYPTLQVIKYNNKNNNNNNNNKKNNNNNRFYCLLYLWISDDSCVGVWNI
jgi:hypothetical protein